MQARDGRTTLILGGVAAIVSSTCCLGPLVLLSLGVSGAWIGNLTKLEPYRPIALAVAMIALVSVHRRIWRTAAECAPGEICAVPVVRRSYKVLYWVVVALTMLGIGFPYLAPFFY